MTFLIDPLYQIVSNFYFLLSVLSVTFLLKTGLLVLAIIHASRSEKIKKPWFFLLLVLIGSMFSDATWIITISKKLFFDYVEYKTMLILFVRLSWAWHIIEYQSLCLFIETLTEKNYIKNYNKLFVVGSFALTLMHTYFAVFKFYDVHDRPPFEYTLTQISSLYVFVIMMPTLYFAFKNIRLKKLPKILTKQLKILIQFLICPSLISDFLQMYPFSFYPGYRASNYAAVSISTILLTFAFYFCAKKMIGLRFLNFNNHVQSPDRFNFINDFQIVLEQLSQVTNLKELGHITQAFFKEAFGIQPSRTLLYLRNLETNKKHEDEIDASNSLGSVVEHFIRRDDNSTADSVSSFLFQTKILIADELAFSNFYDETSLSQEILSFLNLINADIFIPIYEKKIIIAYIIVEREARNNEFYTKMEHDEMTVFASYLANVINLLKNRNLNSLIQQEKEMREELYIKHQEINQYKESIRSFLHDTQQRKIGIIFYKNRKFSYGNQAAKEFIDINPNTQDGHSLTKALKTIVHNVQEYKTAQTLLVKDTQGNKIVISGISNLEENNIIITIYYPEIADILKEQLSQAKNPSEWDYILYLETTQTGKLINHLIPGTGQHLLNFKIELLKMSLSKKALLLDIPEQDLTGTVEILHHISLRETLYMLKLQAYEKNHDTAIKLFGINPIFGKSHEQPLLERLNNNGTLFIQNINFLSLETQEHLVEFICYGYYHIFKSDQKTNSNVRIICSANQNLQTLVQAGKFSKALFNELKQTTLSMPSLITLPEKELNELAQGFTEQAIKTQTFKNLLELTPREKDKLVHARPVSLEEFRTKIQTILVHKSKKNKILQETQFDPAYNITDPELIVAARLGKKALKDPKIMALLWNKFNNQNKIAAFLGVNRSSVNRRCKEYALDTTVQSAPAT